MLQSLAGTIRHKAYRKRVLTRDVRWSFGNGFQIAVALYAMLQTAVKGSHTYLKAQNNEPLRSEGAYICNDTGEKVKQRQDFSCMKLTAHLLKRLHITVGKIISTSINPAECSVEAVKGCYPTCCGLFDGTLARSALTGASALRE